MEKLTLQDLTQARRARICRKCKEVFLAHLLGQRICPECQEKKEFEDENGNPAFLLTKRPLHSRP
jgi:Zn finger protein HypA/HybF involved in hydrogenase expression